MQIRSVQGWLKTRKIMGGQAQENTRACQTELSQSQLPSCRAGEGTRHGEQILYSLRGATAKTETYELLGLILIADI